jgi:hypothetical protein
MRYLVAIGAALSLVVIPASAAAEPQSGEPVKLTDAELDEVAAGRGALPLFARIHISPINITLSNVTVIINIQNSTLNLAAVLQLNVLGNAIQNATVSAIQMVR